MAFLFIRSGGVFPVRYDKKNKCWFLYSKAYEVKKSVSKKSDEKFERLIMNCAFFIARLNFLESVRHTPEAVQMIEEAWMEFQSHAAKDHPANGYAKKVYEEWSKMYGEKIVRERMGA
jgi:hypothetical protein